MGQQYALRDAARDGSIAPIARAMRLGVALELLPKDYQVDNIIARIDRLIDDRNIRIRCSELARRTGYDGVPKTCDHILQALRS